MYIAVIGSVFVDVKAYPYGKFIPDGRNPGYEVQIHGGVGRNIAEDLSHIGIDTQFVSLADASGSGKDVIEHLKENRVGTKFMRQTEKGMGKWIAVFNDSGDVAASISVRPDLDPIADILYEHGDEIFKNAESVILEIDIEERAAEKAIALAKKYGKRVFAVVSVMSITLERRKYFSDVHGFICNLQEAEMLFEKKLSDMDPAGIADHISKHIGEMGFEKLIVTLGEKGAVYCSKDGEKGFCPAAEAVLVDSTGAGDAFAAGAYAALSKGRSLAYAADTGTRTASFVISHPKNVCPDLKKDIFGLNADKTE